MPARNLADPSFEPTDDDFAELLHHAGEDARAEHRAAEQALRAALAAERTKRLAEVARAPVEPR